MPDGGGTRTGLQVDGITPEVREDQHNGVDKRMQSPFVF